MRTLFGDLRYAFRMMRGNLRFTAAALLALALGIGANTMLFSVVNSVLLSPLPYADPERLVLINGTNARRELPRTPASPPDFIDWQAQQQVFKDIGAYASVRYNLTGRDVPQTINGQRVTPNIFPLLGVSPLLGRNFLPEEGRAGGARVVILSHALWQRDFGAAQNVVGQSVVLNNVSHTVVGVMPPRLSFPPPISSDQGVAQRQGEVWTPLVFDEEELKSRQYRFLRVIGRLRDGVEIGQARSEMSTIARRLEADHKRTNTDWGVMVTPLYEDIVSKVRPALLFLLGAVALILLIACANVANLLLSRSTARQKEFAIRIALGATRWRLIRQLLTESLALSLLGALIGGVLAAAGLRLFVANIPPSLAIPRLNEVRLDFTVLLFTLAVSVVTAILFGLLPALQVTRANLNETLKEGGRHSGGGVRHKRALGLVTIAEVALALVLLICAGLMIKSFLRLLGTPLGFRPESLLTMEMYLPESKYPEAERIRTTYHRVLAQVGSAPGVASAALVSSLPLGGGNVFLNFAIEGRPSTSPLGDNTAAFRFVSPGYAKTMSIPLLKGRDFTERDTRETPPVILIDEVMAQRFWPGEDPIDKRISIMGEEPVTVAGVVGAVKHAGLEKEAGATIYLPYLQVPPDVMAANGRQMTLVVRADARPDLVQSVREQVMMVDKDQPVFNIKTMGEVVSGAVAQPRFYMALLGGFAALALTLSAMGVYGVISNNVIQRTREIGVRIALGAQPGDVLKMMLRQGVPLILIGVVIGLAAAFLLTRVMKSLLFGVSVSDPLIFAGSSVLLVLVGFAASYLPARKATKVDPLIALTSE